MRAGMLYREFIVGETDESILQLVVPTCKREKLIKYFHDIPSAGHLGAEKILKS